MEHYSCAADLATGPAEATDRNTQSAEPQVVQLVREYLHSNRDKSAADAARWVTELLRTEDPVIEVRGFSGNVGPDTTLVEIVVYKNGQEVEKHIFSI